MLSYFLFQIEYILLFKLKNFSKLKVYTVTFLLFTHVMSTEKVRKDSRNRKDIRGTKYTYHNS